MNKALIVLDVQQGVFKEDIHNKAKVIQTINTLIDRCRLKDVPVIFIQHEDEDLKAGEPDFEICPELHRLETDCHITKTKWDAFYRTPLDAYLKARSITQLYIVGAQTEYCMDTTIRCGFSLGYKFFFFTDGHTTFDNTIPAGQIIMHHQKIWDQRFGNLMDIDLI
ncbi:MAG: cysteine hydrolase [Desulfobacterales bacterium]|nr:cysteine hydrolase [Desulfobacterales bacterium]